MVFRIISWIFLICSFPVASFAQQSSSGNALTNTQKEGRRLFVQRCSICHISPNTVSKPNGPSLSKDLVEGNEDLVREAIMDGREGKMPGYKYGMEPSEIDAIVEYLKTVERPVRTKN
jgi:mono/diheme cytochrome c family protein